MHNAHCAAKSCETYTYKLTYTYTSWQSKTAEAAAFLICTKQRKFGHDQFIIQWSEASGARCFDLFFMMFNFWKSQIDLDILCGASLLTILLRVKRLDWGLNLFKPPRWWGAQWREVDNPTSIKSRSTSRQTAAQGANMSHPTLFEEVHRKNPLGFTKADGLSLVTVV